MKILLLAHAFNGLTQRLFVELRALGHEVTVELDIADAVTEEAVAGFDPDVLLAPFLKRRIPESVWSRRVCLVVHPGPPGDRGPAALDWAVLHGEHDWGVTVLQAQAEFDAGPVWAWRPLRLRRDATKASLYRKEVTAAAVEAAIEALGRVVPGSAHPAGVPPPAGVSPPAGVLPAAGVWRAAGVPPAPDATRGWQPPVPAARRALDLQAHGVSEMLARVRSADGHPGATAVLFGEPCRVFDAHPATPHTLMRAPAGAPGTVVARRGPALLVRAVDGGVWIGHVRRGAGAGGAAGLKLAATRAFAREAASLPELAVPLMRDESEWDELRYHEFGPESARVGWLDFEFHNGAMSERQARWLVDALRMARTRATRVLVLAGGRDFFCNGIHLHEIEAAAHEPGDSAADASWRHIEAIDDVALEILQCTDRLTVAALRGSAGAGGCFLALAADRVWARDGVVLNPHYRNMGNLYGSEYWTYLLPRRVGDDAAQALMRERLPMGAAQALAQGLIDEAFGDEAFGDDAFGDDAFGNDVPGFEQAVAARALALAAAPGHDATVAAKAAARARDEAAKPLASYRAGELERMRRNFYGFDPSYHVARHHFVHRKPHAWTPRHLALHR